MKTLRALFRSQGGVHPAYRKQATGAMPVESMPLSKVLFVSMVQHMGAPARPVVKKGDAVMRGQVLGEAGGYVSAPVHAPTSGKVIAISERPTQAGQFAPLRPHRVHVPRVRFAHPGQRVQLPGRDVGLRLC